MWTPVLGWRSASLLLAAVALALLAWRFTRLDLAAFINDEARILEGGSDQLRTGRWVSAVPYPGTQGVRYGPASFWFYGVVSWIWSDHPRTAIIAMCAVVSLAQIALAAALARAFGGGPWLFATLLALLASSPYHFFWSRLAWDQTVDWTSAAIVALLALHAQPRWPTGLAVGALLGFAISSHLMVLPFAAALALTLGLEAAAPPEGRRRWIGFMAGAGAGVLLVSLPYLRFLTSAPLSSMHAAPLDLGTLAAFAFEPVRVATTWGIEYFFDDDWQDFQRWLGGFGVLWRGGLAAAALLAVVTLFGLIAALRSADDRQRRLGRLGVLTWILVPPVLATRTLARHPQYQWPTWWIVFVGLAATLAWLRRHGPIRARVGVVAVWLLAALQCGFVGAWLRYIDDRLGTRGVHYGTPVGHQEAVMEAVCRHPEERLVLSNETGLFRRPLAYWSRVLPECRDKQVVVCGAGARAGFLACPEPDPGERRLRLVYAREIGGALRVEP